MFPPKPSKMNESPSATAALALARQSTLQAGTARIELVIDFVWHVPPSSRRRRGGWLRPVLKFGKTAGKQLLKVASRGHDFRHLSGQGVLDWTRRSYLLDFDSYVRLYTNGQEWHGTSNRALTPLPPDGVEPPSPFWLLDVLAGVTTAKYVGDDEVRGRRCRRIAATTDLSRASAATPGGVAVPARRRFEELLELPLEVWVHDAHVRRIRFSDESATQTLELWDFGAPLEELDWDSPPTFRSQHETNTAPR